MVHSEPRRQRRFQIPTHIILRTCKRQATKKPEKVNLKCEVFISGSHAAFCHQIPLLRLVTQTIWKLPAAIFFAVELPFQLSEYALRIISDISKKK